MRPGRPKTSVRLSAQPHVASVSSERALVGETQIANGRRKIFFPPTTELKRPAPRISKLDAKAVSEVTLSRRSASLHNNLEIRGAGSGGGWEEYFPPTVPEAASSIYSLRAAWTNIHRHTCCVFCMCHVDFKPGIFGANVVASSLTQTCPPRRGGHPRVPLSLSGCRGWRKFP